MFTGGSQFGLVGVVAGGGNPIAGAATAIMLGSRNALYGLHVAEVLGVSGWRRVAGGPAGDRRVDGDVDSVVRRIGRPGSGSTRPALRCSDCGISGRWSARSAPRCSATRRLLGLDAAVPAAFLALLAPRLRGREAWTIAALSAALAIALTPLVPPGLPVLIAAGVAAALASAAAGRPDPADSSDGAAS